MQSCHEEKVARLEKTIEECETKHQDVVAEYVSEISRSHRDAEGRLSNLQKLAADEKEALLTKIWLMSTGFLCF